MAITRTIISAPGHLSIFSANPVAENGTCERVLGGAPEHQLISHQCCMGIGQRGGMVLRVALVATLVF